jgi:hypothetical protein
MMPGEELVAMELVLLTVPCLDADAGAILGADRQGGLHVQASSPGLSNRVRAAPRRTRWP